MVARFLALGPTSLDIEVLCWFATTDFDEFRVCRQEALLGIMRVVQEAGASFALPAGAMQVVAAPAAAAPAAPPAQPRGRE